MTTVLPDVLKANLKVVFCGTAASAKSAHVGAYYAGPGNRFWEALYTIGLTPYQLKPLEFHKVLQYSIGLTDLAQHSSGNDDTLKRDDFDAEALRQRILTEQPAILAFTSKRAAQEFLGQSVVYGWHAKTIGKTRLFILPSPSGAARRYWNIQYWQQLADAVNHL